MPSMPKYKSGGSIITGKGKLDQRSMRASNASGNTMAVNLNRKKGSKSAQPSQSARTTTVLNRLRNATASFGTKKKTPKA